MRFVAVKNEEQQSVLSLHRIREQLIKVRTMQVNQIRGLLYEFGADLPQGRQKGLKEVPDALADLEESLSPMFLDTVRQQLSTHYILSFLVFLVIFLSKLFTLFCLNCPPILNRK